MLAGGEKTLLTAHDLLQGEPTVDRCVCSCEKATVIAGKEGDNPCDITRLSDTAQWRDVTEGFFDLLRHKGGRICCGHARSHDIGGYP